VNAPGYLSLPKRTQDKLELLWKEADKKGALCINKTDEYIDYPEEETPTQEEAQLMCFGCPVRALCKQVAREADVTYGVWGGEVYNEQ